MSDPVAALKNSSIVLFWEKLKTVHEVVLQCTKDPLRHGFAKVIVTSEESEVILFYEKGEWLNINLSFSNVLRWRLHPEGIALEHLRFGSNIQ